VARKPAVLYLRRADARRGRPAPAAMIYALMDQLARYKLFVADISS